MTLAEELFAELMSELSELDEAEASATIEEVIKLLENEI